MWYRCGNGQCYATSHDGIKWDKPLDINTASSPLAKTNIVDNHNFDGSTVWLDLRPDTPKDERYKMAVVCEVSCSHYTIKYSADGVNWRTMVNETGPTSDRATIFYNPFRNKWVYSIKTGFESKDPAFNLGRSRKYWDGDDLVLAGNYTAQQPYNWTNADFLDPAVGCLSSAGNSFTQLYNLDAVAYESVLVGLFSIFTGKDCGTMCNVTGQRCSPYNRTGEWDSVFLGFSRDGYGDKAWPPVQLAFDPFRSRSFAGQRCSLQLSLSFSLSLPCPFISPAHAFFCRSNSGSRFHWSRPIMPNGKVQIAAIAAIHVAECVLLSKGRATDASCCVGLAASSLPPDG